MATGRFWLALVLALVSTVLAIVGYGWHLLQAFGMAALLLGILRVFGIFSL
jgi:hypothetical protein